MEDQRQGRASDLRALAEAKFGKLSDAERLLLENVPSGKWAKCGPKHAATDPSNSPAKEDDADPNNNPRDADNWKPPRPIRAELVAWLCMDEHARKHVHWRGIQVFGADVTGPLDLQFANVPFQLAFRHCRLGVAINLSNAVVSQLDLQGSLVQGIVADGVIVKHTVFLTSGFAANGEVRFPEAHIGGGLECSNGTFTNPGGGALTAYLAVVRNGIIMGNGFAADGEVNLEGAQITGPFNCADGNFQKATLKLTDASAGSLIDSGLNNNTGSVVNEGRTIWPQQDKLFLDGFVYGHIYSEGRINVDNRIGWLGLQLKSPFRRQPYLNLAKVLQDSGDSDGALRVLERMEELRRSEEEHGPIAHLGSWVLKGSIGYGYYPARAIWEIVGLSALGWIIYRRSYLARTMVPSEKDAYQELKVRGRVPEHYPTFSPLIYSVENSLPLVKLGQADKWQPDPGPGVPQRPTSFLSRFATSPRFVIWFLRIQILLGWLLATLFVAGVSGIVHKE